MHPGLVGYGYIGQATPGLLGDDVPRRVTVQLRPGPTPAVLCAEVADRVGRGTAAEDLLDFDALTVATMFFSCRAREVAQAFAKNSRVVAVPAAGSAEPDSGVRIDNRESEGNATTSAPTIYTVLRGVRNRRGPVAI